MEGILQNHFHVGVVLLNNGDLHGDARKYNSPGGVLDPIHLCQRRKTTPEMTSDPDVSPRNRDEADRMSHHRGNVLRKDPGHAPFFRSEAAMHLY